MLAAGRVEGDREQIFAFTLEEIGGAGGVRHLFGSPEVAVSKRPSPAVAGDCMRYLGARTRFFAEVTDDLMVAHHIPPL